MEALVSEISKIGLLGAECLEEMYPTELDSYLRDEVAWRVAL